MGNPTDPLERMLIEQAAFSHLMVLQLHVFTSAARSDDGAGIYAAAAARLLGELRRTILAFKEYRSPPTRPQVTRIEQQNVAHSQEIKYQTVAGGDQVTMVSREKEDPNSKLGSNSDDDGRKTDQIPSPRSRWAAQPPATGAAV